MRLDRGMQRAVLERLRDVYPNSADVSAFDQSSQEGFQANLFYLEERGLIQGSHEMGPGSPIVLARMTADGLDFLEDDGGIDAIRTER